MRPRDAASHRHRASACLNCAATINASAAQAPLDDDAAAAGRPAGPGPGDAAVCGHCGHLMIFDDRLAMREPTGDELLELAGNPALVETMEIAAAVFGRSKPK